MQTIMYKMRFAYSLLLLLCTVILSAQHTVSPLNKRDRFNGYVLSNGKRVDAVCHVKDTTNKTIGIGNNSYKVIAIDTTLAGKIVVPPKIMAPDGLEYTVTSVSRHAFADCRRITEVVLPDSIHDIGDQAFMNCRSLRSIVLPPGTRYLWPYAFRGCSNLRRVEVRATVPPDSYNDVFDDHTLRFATLVIPASSAKAYKYAFVWNMFRYCIPNWDLRF